jgi:hypothetical protein
MGFFGTVFGIIAGLALVPIYAFYFLLGETGHQRPLAGLSAGAGFEVQGRGGVRDQFDQRLPRRLLSRPGAGGDLRRHALHDRLCADRVALRACCSGVLATCLTIIPFLGAITTCVTALDHRDGGLRRLAASGAGAGRFSGWCKALEGFVIQPKIMGDRVGLHPVTIIVALMVGTTLLGGISRRHSGHSAGGGAAGGDGALHLAQAGDGLAAGEPRRRRDDWPWLKFLHCEGRRFSCDFYWGG